MKSYLTRVKDKKKIVMAVLQWKQGLLCDKIDSVLIELTGVFLYKNPKLQITPFAAVYIQLMGHLTRLYTYKWWLTA